ncbi:MAG: carbohydrate ABC transporter permease [Syntrophomonadaceae bacterium]|jgi:raffinose/stachyose/melibiose transport system permease protein|nr:carbohydrate ABC transporter permease [Syntrophomonadaceae bacterium]
MRARKLTAGILINAVTCCVSLVFILPLLVVLLNAFKSKAESNTMTLKLPAEWMFENFQTVVERGKLFLSFFNSLFYAGTGAVLIVFLIGAAGFVLARNRSGIHRFVYYFIILGIALPINNVTLMKIMKLLGLVNTQAGIILIYTAINLPISLFIVFGFIRNIPVEVDEAAIIDGCTARQLLLKIGLPLLSPVMVTIFVLNFMAIWNDFTMPLYYLNNSGKWPMTLAVYNFFGIFENQWNLVCADITLTILPVLIIFVLAQKYIVGGVSAGAVKG